MKYFSYCSQQCFTSVTTTPFEEVIPTLFTAVSVLQVLQQHLSEMYLPCCSQQSEFYRCYYYTFQRHTCHASLLHSSQYFTGVTTTPFKDIFLQVLQQHLSEMYLPCCSQHCFTGVKLQDIFRRGTYHAVHAVSLLQVLQLHLRTQDEVFFTLFTAVLTGIATTP